MSIRMTHAAAGLFTAAILAFGAGCTRETKTTEGPAGKKLSVQGPSDTSVKQGETATISVDITRTNFNEPIELKFVSLPDGVTIMENDRTISKDVTVAKLTLKATPDAAPVKDQKVTVSASGGGMTQAVDFKVTVNKGADVSKKLTLKSPGDTNINQGETAAISVDINRERFNDPVELKFTGLPEGVTVMEADRTISKDASNAKLTLKATPEAKLVADQKVTVTASGGGVTQETTFLVTVKKKG